MTVVDHVHRGYKYGKKVDGGFDCDECKRLNMLSHKRARLRADSGTSDTVITDKHAIEQLRDRVKILRRRGYTLTNIARETGISDITLGKICKPGKFPTGVMASTLNGFTSFWERVQADQAELPVWHAGDHNAELARAAVQGLWLRGWTGSWIAEQVGLVPRSVNAIGRGEIKAVHPETEAKLVKLAQQYGTTDGPSSITRGRAQRAGYQSTAMRDELL